MNHLLEHTNHFIGNAKDCLEGMFGLSDSITTSAVETRSLDTEMTFIVSVYYTGTVYGEYIIAMSEDTAAKALGIDIPASPQGIPAMREEIREAFSESLNMIVGQSIDNLRQEYPKLTFASPRVFFGEVRYPAFRTGKGSIQTSIGPIECHFCIDRMRLDLATSYDEVIHSLMDVNEKLKEANRHLAEQQAQLVQSEKLASVGMLAAGVAHEINSPLFFVDSNLNVLNDYIQVIESTFGIYESLVNSISAIEGNFSKSSPLDDQDQDIYHILTDTKDLIHETCDGVQRIKNIVKGLKEFSQMERGETRETNLNEVVAYSVQLIQHQFLGNCTIETSLASIPAVFCNSGEISQVVVNLLLNAAQSIEEDGKIEIRTFRNDQEAIIQVSDSGCGMDEATMEKIFDPFFTTKPVGEGTGLGLSISYGILQKHKGSIDVCSTVGRGSTFTVRLPLVSSNALVTV